MSKPELSIIIPLYNKVGQVTRCMSSIMAQDYTDFEVVVVDDGSTDGSADKVTSEFNDNRIRFIKTSNAGVSSARNRGIKEARGTFLLFIDADDYISPGYLSHVMSESVSHEADLYIWGLTKDHADGSKEEIKPTMRGLLHRGEFLHEMVQEQYVRHEGLMGYIPNKLLRREWVQRNGIMFDTRLHLMEDYDFYLSCYNFVQTVYCFDECGYHYVEQDAQAKPSPRKVDFISLLDIHRRCMMLVKDSIDSESDYRVLLRTIGKLSLAMFLEMRPVTFSAVRHSQSAIRQRPWCAAGLRLIQPKQRRLQKSLISNNSLGTYLYLKGRQLIFSLRRHQP